MPADVPDWTVGEFMETALGEAALEMEERMDMALGKDFEQGDVSERLDLLFEGICDIDEIAFYCNRVSQVYGSDVLQGGVTVQAAIQGAVSQAICLGIIMERRRVGDGP